MSVNFTKMHSLGNDFVMIDLITQAVKIRTAEIKRLADRHFGIGCDQVILIEPPIRGDADFYYRIFNANGQEVEQCGNGARCAARFFYENKFTNQRILVADCLAGSLECLIEENKTVTLNMGSPILEPEKIPFLSDRQMLLYPIQIENISLEMSVLSMGNPHAIIQVPHFDPKWIKKIGPLLSRHSVFPNEANIGFMQIIDRSKIYLRTYERGVGETYACGSNACAAVVAGIKQGLLDDEVTVQYQTGILKVRLDVDNSVHLTGPATHVFTGRFYFH